MRIISLTRPGEVFAPVPQFLAKIVPEVLTIELEFKQPDRVQLMASHYATLVGFTFKNGRRLDVPGHMLWHFPDMIPEALGSEEHGYSDANVFSAEHGIKIMERVRAAYKVMFVANTTRRLPHPPLTATINFAEMSVTSHYLPALPDATRQELVARAEKRIAALWPEAYAKLAAWVRSEVAQPRTVLGMVAVGNGILRNQYGQGIWPAPEAMHFDAFLGEYSSERFTSYPAHMTQSQCFARFADQAAGPVISEVLSEMIDQVPERVDEAAMSLGVTDEGCSVAALAAALDRSQDANLIFDLVWSRWYRALKPLTLADFGVKQ